MRTLLLATLCLATSSLALAQGSPASDANPIATDRADKAGESVGDRPPFDQVDTNDDGFVSRAELKHDNELVVRFQRHDDDGDERLSQAEYEAIVATSAPDPND